jgi:hypothetical protein
MRGDELICSWETANVEFINGKSAGSIQLIEQSWVFLLHFKDLTSLSNHLSCSSTARRTVQLTSGYHTTMSFPLPTRLQTDGSIPPSQVLMTESTFGAEELQMTRPSWLLNVRYKPHSADSRGSNHRFTSERVQAPTNTDPISWV